MADWGTGLGIGIGIGEAGQAIGQGLAISGQRREAERDKQVAAYDKQAQDIATNIHQLGENSPEAVPYIQQLHRVVDMRNALYGPHETGLLLRSLKGIVGKADPKTYAQDPRANVTAAQMIAQAPIYIPPQGKEDLQQRYQNAYNLGVKLHGPGTKDPWEDAKIVDWALRWATGQKAAYKPGNVVGPNGEVRMINTGDPDEVQAWAEQGYHLGGLAAGKPSMQKYIRADGTPGLFNQNDPAALAKIEQEGGHIYIPGIDNSKEMQFARQMVDGGVYPDMKTAIRESGKSMALAQQAKNKLDTDEPITEEMATALATETWLNPQAKPIFRYGSSAANARAATMYNRALAGLYINGKVPALLQGKADIKADTAALTDVAKKKAQLDINEENAKKNFEALRVMADTLTAEVWQTSMPKLNEAIQDGYKHWTSGPGASAVVQFQNLLYETFLEYGRVASGQTTGQALTDSARHEMANLLSQGYSPKVIKDWIDNVGYPLMKNRTTSAGDIQQGLRDNIGRVPGAAPGAAPPGATTPPAEDFRKKYNYGPGTQ